MENVYIVNGARTPIGHFGKSLKEVPAVDLAAVAIKEAIKRSEISSDMVEDVILGAIHQEGMGNNPARIAALKANIPYTSGALTVNNVCSSGMKSVEIAAYQISMGKKDIIIAGGMESNSQCPYMLMDARWGYKLKSNQIVDALFYDGFSDTYGMYGGYDHVGETAENIVENKETLCSKYNLPEINLTFEDINKFALESHQKYFRAKENGFFKEIVPINENINNKAISLFEDESPREDLNIDILNNLKPIFRKNGSVTVGNTPPLNDGAAAIVLISKRKAKELGLNPMGSIISFSSGNVEPKYMGLGPIPAIKNLLEENKMQMSDIDLFEINEAQAQQVLFCMKGLGIRENKLNIHGGAIAIGHPPGMTGTRLILTALYALRFKNKKFAISAQCAGGGTGMAVLLKKDQKRD